MNNPLVSILLPVYNTSAYLPQCLDSVLSQTYENLQVVLVDDGSKDNSLEICQQYAAKDSRIEVYHQENQGVATARNVLLSKIKGDYFFFVDSDDWIELDMIEFLLTRAEKERADIVTCDIVINDSKVSSDYFSKIYSKDEAVERFLYHLEFRGSLCNKLMKITLLCNGPKFLKDISYGEDALFCWELLKEAKKVVYTDRQFYHYRMLMDSLTHCAFGPKKLSGHKVWSILCDETARLYPQYLDVAHARFCVETTLLLRDAAHCGYQKMDNVKMLQRTIKKYWPCLNKVSITSLKMKIYALLACRSYWLAGKI